MNSHFVSLLWLFYGVARRLPRWTWLAVCAALQIAAAQAATPTVAQLSARIESAARQLLLEQASAKGLVDPVVDLRVATSAQAIPACAAAVAVQALDVRTPTRMRFAAQCSEADGWQREWIVRAEISAMVVVAAVAVPAKQLLAESDLTVERRRVMDLADVVSEPAQAAGQSSSRALRPGQTLQSRWLVAPMLVRRGESVVILARSEGIAVQAAGEALEAGRLRDSVRVRNATTGKVIRAHVIEAGIVEPENIGAISGL